MKFLFQILLLVLTWLTTFANATPPTQKLVLTNYSYSFLTTENQQLASDLNIGVCHFARSGISEKSFSQKANLQDSYVIEQTRARMSEHVVNSAGSVFKAGDNIAGKIVVQVKAGTNGKIAVIGRRMPEHVELVAQEIANQGKQVEIFNDFYQAGKPFDIEGQIYLWEDIVADFNNLKQQYGTIPNNILENSLIFKANQKWANKLLSEGYEVIDMGYPQGTTTESIFYDMELQTIFP